MYYYYLPPSRLPSITYLSRAVFIHSGQLVQDYEDAKNGGISVKGQNMKGHRRYYEGYMGQNLSQS